MATGRRRQRAGTVQEDLFSVDRAAHVSYALDRRAWPAQDAFPINRAGAHVRDVVWADLEACPAPLIVAGFSSISELVHFVADWGLRAHADGQVRLLLGTEPFSNAGGTFGSPRSVFTEEVRRYWLEERGVSLRLSGKVVQAIAAIDRNAVSCRFLPGLHAKLYVGAAAVTMGSSNFTASGLGAQVEANVRFTERDRAGLHQQLSQVAENYWETGQPWDVEFRALLETLLRVVGWREALARACVSLLEGDWARRYLPATENPESRLWPSQRAGIAQALWLLENVGSVLVADATGSGKTRMGAHLARAVSDRLWSTGRVRRDLTVLVCPPGVKRTWDSEAVSCGLHLRPVSHGMLSKSDLGNDSAGDSVGADSNASATDQQAVRRAQILAVDEAHNFLNAGSKRTQRVRQNLADHILLFTATPISKGPTDLLDLVALLGADNFEDRTLEVLGRLDRRRSGDDVLSADETDLLRREIQRFTLRRTKSQLNALVEREPDRYRHPTTSRICRYPRHEVQIFDTGESEGDARAAGAIRAETKKLLGLAQLERILAVPVALAGVTSDESWLRFRLGATKGLVAHQVLNALRSSRAALVEHLLGSTEAAQRFGVQGAFKAVDTGDAMGRIAERAASGPPDIGLACPLPGWLASEEGWAAACQAELDVYARIRVLVDEVSGAREHAKAGLLADLAGRHDRVLAFDHSIITVAVLFDDLEARGVPVLRATGGRPGERHQVERVFAAGSSQRAVALCSDAMNEGFNLQGASAIVHLDLPTTLRVAEQRVGRVDRMDSPYDTIEAWWPRDGRAFATRANERLARRAAASEALLGSNLIVPALSFDVAEGVDEIVTVEAQIEEVAEAGTEVWDGIQDALEPVRLLVTGADALVPTAVYESYRYATERVIARVAPLQSRRPWAFFAVTAASHGAPRWLFVDPDDPVPLAVDLADIAMRLRRFLSEDPPDRPLDDIATGWLDTLLDTAARVEHRLLPRRMQRALGQMAEVLDAWAKKAQISGDEMTAQRLINVAALARPAGLEAAPDPYLVAERWLELVGPRLKGHRTERRNARFVLLRHITPGLIAEPLGLDAVEQAFARLPPAATFDQRVAACILGVPDRERRLTDGTECQ